MKTLLFVQIAESTFDESLFIPRMIQQFSGETRVLALVNGLSSALVSSNPDIITGVLTENQDDNQARFNSMLETAQPDAVIVLDLYKFFLNPLELNFLPVWLEAATMPVFAFDYYHLLVNEDEGIRLNPKVVTTHIEAGERADSLPLNIWLIKPAPPIMPSEGGLRTFFWQPFDSSLNASAPQLREQVLDSIKASPESKVITVFFDPVMFSQALDRNLLGYYFMVIEVLIFYMRSFPRQNFELLVVGSAAPTDQTNPIPDKNFNIHYFTHLTNDNYRALLSASDLLISNTNWSPAILDAIGLGTPAIVMGNSIIQDWKDVTEGEKQLKSFFSPHPGLYHICDLMVQLNQWSATLPIFPFINYPMRHEDEDFPLPGLQEHALPYFLLDMFDDETSLPILKDLLFSPLDLEQYREACTRYTQSTDEAITFGSMLEKVNQS